MVPFGMQIRRNAETKGREVKYQVKEATMVNDREVERDAGVDLLYSRDDAVAMCRALKNVNGGNYFVEQVEPNEYDVAAEGLGLSGWDVMTRVRSVKADGMQKLVDALDSEYAPMAALGFVGTDRRWSVDTWPPCRCSRASPSVPAQTASGPWRTCSCISTTTTWRGA